ncbi:MAG: ABC transporter permease [Deltaproteobacteria bacterium]|nr:ABC transporter permease [Deltaproteobacteria bacterium]
MLTRFKTLLSGIVGEWKLMIREPSILMALLAIPIVYPLVVSWLYQANQVVERPAVVVDDDNSSLSREMILDLDATQEVRVVERPASIDLGWEAIRTGRAEMMVYIPSNLSTRVKRGEQAHVKLWVNSANMLTYGVAYPGASNVINALNEEIGQRFFFGKGMSTEASAARTAPIVRCERSLFHPTMAYGDFLVPGVLMVVVQQAVLIGLALSVGLRKEKEGQPAPTRWPFTAIEARLIAQLALYVAGAAFAVWGIFPLFGWSIQSPFAVFALLVAFLGTIAPAAVLVASLMKDRYEAFQVLMFVSAPMFLMSGFSWPLDQMPAYVRALASLFPVTPALGALRVLTMKTGDLHAIVPFLRTMGIQFMGWLALAIVVTHLVQRTRWLVSRSGSRAST